MKQLGTFDAACLYMDKLRTPINATTIWIYDSSPAKRGKPTFRQVFDHLASRIDRIPLLQKKLLRVPGEIDLPWWVDDSDFDLEYHVRYVQLPEPGNWQQFREQAAGLHSQQLDPARPLWELHMIDGLDSVEGIPPNAFAILFKAHHALVDGKLIMTITDILHSSPPPRGKSSVSGGEPGNELLSKGEVLTRGMFSAALQPFRAARAFGRIAPGLLRKQNDRKPADSKLPAAPKTRFNVPIDSRRVLDTLFFPLDKLKKVRNELPGATINDISIAIFGGALRQYLAGHDELPEAPLRAVVPVALRETAASDAIGNQVSLMVVNMATDVEDPRQRLAAICDGTQAAKNSAAALGPATPLEFLELIPRMLVAPGIHLTDTLLTYGLNIGVNTIVSNIPGPRPPLDLKGCELIRLTGAGPVVDGLGLINYVTSYAGKIGFGFTASRKTMPDPDYYSACIEESFRSICSIAETPRRARRKSG